MHAEVHLEDDVDESRRHDAKHIRHETAGEELFSQMKIPLLVTDLLTNDLSGER